MQKVTAIFDIGKTNKKFFLLDDQYNVVLKKYESFDQIQDEDGHPTEDLGRLTNWMKNLFHDILNSEKYDVHTINFSTYGASLVHLDEDYQPLTPLYNYTKPLLPTTLDLLKGQYGPIEGLEITTASPIDGYLNAGLQLYDIKLRRPALFNQIKYTLHFPQYLSFLFTGIPISDYTSIGCHTSLWDFEKEDYASWVKEEGLDQKFPPIVSPEVSINMRYKGKKIRIGTGIHDSSSSMVPYINSESKPFLLLSTGTWSIVLNPFNHKPLTSGELNNNCLNYMRIDGQPVRASRLFLGQEYKNQVEELTRLYAVQPGHHRSIVFDSAIYQSLAQLDKRFFKWSVLDDSTTEIADKNILSTFAVAYHKLMMELMEEQLKSIKLAKGNSKIKKLFVDGGFVDNDIFVKLLTLHFPDVKIRTTVSPLGSALGAAIVVSDSALPSKFLKKHYGLKKHKPLILTA